MGPISQKIKEIIKRDKITLKELFEKHPYLAELYFEEKEKEHQNIKENKKQIKLLLD